MTNINTKYTLYLDNCCFNRPFDDQTQLLINIESIAKMYIQSRILSGDYNLLWSDMLEYENSKNPFEERSKRIAKWKIIAISIIHTNQIIIDKSKEILQCGVKTKDAIHIASGIVGGANYFLTTDKGILRKANNICEIKILNPIDFVKEMEERNEN